MQSTGGTDKPKKPLGATHQHDRYIIDFINKGFRALQPTHFAKDMRQDAIEGGAYTTDTRAYMELLDRLRIYDYEDSKHNHFPDLLADYEMMEETRKAKAQRRWKKKLAAKEKAEKERLAEVEKIKDSRRKQKQKL